MKERSPEKGPRGEKEGGKGVTEDREIDGELT
jgi:hypothetical protein